MPKCPHCKQNIIEVYFNAGVPADGVLSLRNGSLVEVNVKFINKLRIQAEADSFTCPLCKENLNFHDLTVASNFLIGE